MSRFKLEHATEFLAVRINQQAGLITSRRVLDFNTREWTYVNDFTQATIFPDEHTATTAKHEYCNFPWVTIRPLRDIEYDIAGIPREEEAGVQVQAEEELQSKT